MLLYNPFCPDTPGYTLLLLRAQRGSSAQLLGSVRILLQSIKCVLLLDRNVMLEERRLKHWQEKVVRQDRVSLSLDACSMDCWFLVLQPRRRLVAVVSLLLSSSTCSSVSVWVDSRVYRENTTGTLSTVRGGLGYSPKIDLLPSLVPHLSFTNQSSLRCIC
jgi:hypothetical protein